MVICANCRFYEKMHTTSQMPKLACGYCALDEIEFDRTDMIKLDNSECTRMNRPVYVYEDDETSNPMLIYTYREIYDALDESNKFGGNV